MMTKKILQAMKADRRTAILGLLTLVIILIALCAPWISRYDPLDAVLADALQAPSWEHWFGTDALGRDVFARVIYGTRVSVSSALALVAIIFFTGLIAGILAGFFGGIIDVIIMRLADTMIAFPDLILAIAIAGILGPDIGNAIIAIAVVSWTKYARLARSLVLKMKHSDYVAAARMTGSRNSYLLIRYMLPNVLPLLLVTAAADIGAMMLNLASLSFLGFGVQPPTPEWGYMLSEGRQYFQSAPWLLIFPGLAVFLVVMIFNLLGDRVRDILAPESR